MSIYTPSNQDIISPQPPQKNSNPIWVVLIVLIVLFCCCCLCLGLLATWMFRITIQFLSNLFGWVNPMLAHLSVILMAA